MRRYAAMLIAAGLCLLALALGMAAGGWPGVGVVLGGLVAAVWVLW